MNAEIKTKNSILINRLDENESLILQDILEESKKENSKITLNKLTDETGDFGGVMLTVETIDTIEE